MGRLHGRCKRTGTRPASQSSEGVSSVMSKGQRLDRQQASAVPLSTSLTQAGLVRMQTKFGDLRRQVATWWWTPRRLWSR